MTFTQDGIAFKVSRFDNAQSKPYFVNFKDYGVRLKFTFKTDGSVKNIKVGTEKYRVVYRTNGDLRRVVRTDYRARMPQTEDIKENTMFDHRHLYACHDCA